MKFTLDQHIGVFENALPDSYCDELIQFFEDNAGNSLRREDYWETIAGSNKGKAVDTALMLDDFLNTKPQVKKFSDFFFKKFSECWKLYTRKCNVIDQGFKLEAFKIQKTVPTEGYHIFHYERPPAILHDESSTPEEVESFIKMYHRIGVYTLYLNDVEEGGETEFLMQSKRVPPKKGTVCIFPAGYTHVHRGNPPLVGTKYIMTGWLLLPDLPEHQQPKNNK